MLLISHLIRHGKALALLTVTVNLFSIRYHPPLFQVLRHDHPTPWVQAGHRHHSASGPFMRVPQSIWPCRLWRMAVAWTCSVETARNRGDVSDILPHAHSNCSLRSAYVPSHHGEFVSGVWYYSSTGGQRAYCTLYGTYYYVECVANQMTPGLEGFTPSLT